MCIYKKEKGRKIHCTLLNNFLDPYQTTHLKVHLHQFIILILNIIVNFVCASGKIYTYTFTIFTFQATPN